MRKLTEQEKDILGAVAIMAIGSCLIYGTLKRTFNSATSNGIQMGVLIGAVAERLKDKPELYAEFSEKIENARYLDLMKLINEYYTK